MPNVTENLVITVLMTWSPIYFDICVASFLDCVTLLLLVRCSSVLLN